MPTPTDSPMNMTVPEMWMFGIFITIIMGLIAFIIKFWLNSIKYTLASIVTSIGEIKTNQEKTSKMVVDLDKEMALVKRSIETSDKEVEQIKKNSIELEKEIRVKLRMITP